MADNGNDTPVEDKRVAAILMVCFIFSIPMTGLFISAAAAQAFTALHFISMLVLMTLMLGISGVVWYLSEQTHLEDGEKAKRDRLEHVLRNLSDAELKMLKQRLTDNTIDDEMLYAHLTDDGEIAYDNRTTDS
ncbi:MAG: hypothetical protein ACPG7F_09185 [Aggregatilineales bacterium]